MPTVDNVKVVKNIDFKDESSKKSKKLKIEEEEEEFSEEVEENDETSEEETDDDNDDDDEDEDENDLADGLTDLGLYNVLGNFFVDEEGNTVGTSLSTIAKELAKLNHHLKKYLSKN